MDTRSILAFFRFEGKQGRRTNRLCEGIFSGVEWRSDLEILLLIISMEQYIGLALWSIHKISHKNIIRFFVLLEADHKMPGMNPRNTKQISRLGPIRSCQKQGRKAINWISTYYGRKTLPKLLSKAKTYSCNLKRGEHH